MEDKLASDLLVLQSHLDGLMDSTQKNIQILRRFQHFEMKLMDFNSLRDILEYILNDMRILFDADLITFCLVDEKGELQSILLEEGFQSKKMTQLIYLKDRELLQSTFGFSLKPYCGVYKKSSCGGFFAHPKKKPGQVIIIPLNRRSRLLGSVNLASFNPEFFADNNSSVFVEHLGAVISLTIENSLHFEMLRRTSLIDTLTGVNNRRFLEQRIGEEIDRTQRNREPLCCLFLDIDHFKVINDNYGHQAGDLVLVAVASAIREQLRNIDVLARYGGEEFVALLSDINEIDAFEIAERIRQQIHGLVFSAVDVNLQLTISIGISMFIPDKNSMQNSGEIASKLIQCADAALYKAKKSGRNRVIISGDITEFSVSKK